jgi:hypothetical protein
LAEAQTRAALPNPAHGEPVLAEEKVLAWLTQHGATVRTGSLSHITAVEGVRVVD